MEENKGYSSHLDEKVFITEEDLIELKLYGASWIIYIQDAHSKLQDYVLRLLYENTNLFIIDTIGRNVITVIPKVPIKIKYNDMALRVLYPDCLYYVWRNNA